MIHGVEVGDGRRTTATNSQKGELKVFCCANTQPLEKLSVLSSVNVHVGWRVCITPEREGASAQDGTEELTSSTSHSCPPDELSDL